MTLNSEPNLPKHVGIILDGNRRWAVNQGLPTFAGHEAGAKVALQAVSWAEAAGIAELTMWLLSTENTARPAEELVALYSVITDLVQNIIATGVQVRILGSLDSLPAASADQLQVLSASSTGTKELQVNLAIGYGGRAEIVDAMRMAIHDTDLSALTADATPQQVREYLAQQINEVGISQHLYTASQPDLIIRTSGELRLSGFMLWQSMHSELFFSNTLWPEFTQAEFQAALADFAQRSRRFGA